jgi:hypothetical protein
VILALAATLNAFRQPTEQGLLPGRGWDTVFMLAIDLQVLLGLVLYFGLSPFMVEAMNDLGGAMRQPGLRFWAVEHAGGMFAAMMLVRTGRVLASSSTTISASRSRRLACFALATLVVLASIPWPGLANGRPLFRL